MKKFNFITTITKEIIIEAETEEKAWDIYCYGDKKEKETFSETNVYEMEE